MVVNVPFVAPLVEEAATEKVETLPLLTFDSLQEKFKNSGISVEPTQAPEIVNVTSQPYPALVERGASVETASPPNEFREKIQLPETEDIGEDLEADN